MNFLKNNILTSRLAMVVELAVYAFVLAVATFIESRQGSFVARAMVYNAWWFYILQALMVYNFIGMSVRFGLWKQRKYGVLMLHYAFAIILAGAMVTHLWGMEGMMHIRQGQTAGDILTEQTYLSLSVKQDGRLDNFQTPLRRNITGKGYVKDRFELNDSKINVTTEEFCTHCGQMNMDRLTVNLEYGNDKAQVVLEGTKYWDGEPIYVNLGDLNVTLSYGSMRQAVPFAVTLDEFRLVRYPGSRSPSSYESDVTVHQAGNFASHKIYMNNVVHVGSYRLYQSSFDQDEKGTILTVNRDRWGTMITYLGYILLLTGMMLSLIHRNSHFRTLLRKIGKPGAVAVALCFLSLGSFAQEVHNHDHNHDYSERGGMPPVTLDRAKEQREAINYIHRWAVPQVEAEKFGSLLVQTHEGRIEPIDTYASKIVRKISRSNKILGLNPDQALLGMMGQPYYWSWVPFVKVSNQELLRKAGGGTDGYISFIDVFDDSGEYMLTDEVESVYAKPVAERSKYDKELLKLDEKINILHALFYANMLAIFPHQGDTNNKWYSPGDDLSVFEGRDSMFVSTVFRTYLEQLEYSVQTNDWEGPDQIIEVIAKYQSVKSDGLDIDSKRIKAEISYNKLNIFKWAGFAYMGIGLLLLIVLIINLLRNSKTLSAISGILAVAIILIFLWQSFGIGLRWYISGRAPWANAYESMIYVGWATALAGMLFIRRSRMTLALAAFFAGVILFVSNLNWMDPEITPLVPVLKSLWLVIHVAVITGSYGFFGIGFLLGFISLLMMIFRTGKNELRVTAQIEELSSINQIVLTIGLILMTAGTFLGAIWANESWGRYWGWDPKETWALITMIVYAFIIHARFVPFFRGSYAFSVMSVIGFASVLMTFFGVNYYLSGLHSYGGDSAPPAINAIYIVYSVVLLVIIAAGLRNSKQLK